MPKINVLEKHVAELIAAGEVVERPASVIKELVENSIDAGATMITVEIQNGGVTFMRVTDNGCGISRQDVPVAFLRHATSKILKKDDLDGIATLGFRGEALASICAVARVEVLTCAQGETVGTHYVIEGGDEISCADAGCPQGTTILVKDLFYNTPARMKFLKKDSREGVAVGGVIEKIALSHPEVCVRFLRDGKEILHTPGDGKLRSAIFSVYGKQMIDGMLPVEYEYNQVKVHGFVGKPSEARPTRNFQTFFLNGRYVKCKTAMAALEEAFKGSVMVGKFPICVLNLELSCSSVDVNVHPAKIEVRFANERPIFEAVHYAVKNTLAQQERRLPVIENLSSRSNVVLPAMPEYGKQLRFTPANSAPKTEKREVFLPKDWDFSETVQEEKKPEVIPENKPEMKKDPVGLPVEKSQNTVTFRDSGGVSAYVPEQPFPMMGRVERKTPEPPRRLDLEEIPSRSVTQDVFVAPAEPEPEAEPNYQEVESEKPLQYIGELFHTYLLLQAEKTILLVDKHAAHERILYEKLKKQGHTEYQQFLLDPITVTLETSEYDAVLENESVLEEAGFSVQDFGMGTLLVRSAPLYLENQDIASAVVEIAGYLSEHKSDVTTQHLEWLYHNIACRAAIKAGDRNDPRELLDLIQQLYDDPSIRYCPHGRPVFVEMSKYEIEKKFGRV